MATAFDENVYSLLDSHRLREYYLVSHPQSLHYLRKEPLRRVRCSALFLAPVGGVGGSHGLRVARVAPFRLACEPAGDGDGDGTGNPQGSVVRGEALATQLRRLESSHPGFALADQLLFSLHAIDKASLPVFAKCAFSANGVRRRHQQHHLDACFWSSFTGEGDIAIPASLLIFHESCHIFFIYRGTKVPTSYLLVEEPRFLRVPPPSGRADGSQES